MSWLTRRAEIVVQVDPAYGGDEGSEHVYEDVRESIDRALAPMMRDPGLGRYWRAEFVGWAEDAEQEMPAKPDLTLAFTAEDLRRAHRSGRDIGVQPAEAIIDAARRLNEGLPYVLARTGIRDALDAFDEAVQS
jgi:hypothetical protein